MFKIKAVDGKEYGPVTAEVLRQWIAQGRVGPQTLVQTEGSTEWKPAADFAELKDLFAAPAPPGLPPQPAFPGASPVFSEQNKSLAVASLILGCLALVCAGVLTGIPAIITGHMAHSRARRSPGQYGGEGLALTGLIMGYASLLLTFALVGMLVPSLTRAKGRAVSVNCVSNMRQIGLAARMYANDHSDVFPTDFQSMSNELVSPKILHCPADTRHAKPMSWAEFTPANVSYELLRPGAKVEEVERQPLFRCPIHHHVGYGDGSVVPGDRNPARRAFPRSSASNRPVAPGSPER